MAEQPRRGPWPREQGSRAAPGRGGARGQRGRRPVLRGRPGRPLGGPACVPHPDPFRRPPSEPPRSPPDRAGSLLPARLSQPRGCFRCHPGVAAARPWPLPLWCPTS
ncbi:hypothetical protein H8959_010992, partial [Pygathrix nigripes]